MGKKISNQVAAASGNDPAPVLSVQFEPLPLEGIDFVTNDADDGHGFPLNIRRGLSVAAQGQSATHGGNADDGFAAVDLRR
jgi:hypothetical protein